MANSRLWIPRSPEVSEPFRPLKNVNLLVLAFKMQLPESILVNMPGLQSFERFNHRGLFNFGFFYIAGHVDLWSHLICLIHFIIWPKYK